MDHLIPDLTTPDKSFWIEKLVNGNLRHFLLSNQYVKAGEEHTYSDLLGISRQDLQHYFEANGYPEWDIPESEIRSEPRGGEYEICWTRKDGVYTAYWLERGTTTPEYKTTNKEEFATWWKKYTLDRFEGQCTYVYTF